MIIKHMKNGGNRTLAGSLLLCLCLFLSFSASAAEEDEGKDYHPANAEWYYDDDSGEVLAVWDEAEDKTSYHLFLYKGTTAEKHKINEKATTVSGEEHSYANLIAKNGTGNYYFSVQSTRGGVSTRIYSDVLEVDSDMLQLTRNYIDYQAVSKPSSGNNSKKALNLLVPLGWKQNPDGTWQYRLTDTAYARNQFLNINGKWYYFGADGIMLTGWQTINGKYYFFNPSGDLWTGGNPTAGSMPMSGGASSQSPAKTSVLSANTSGSGTDSAAGHPYNAMTQQITSVTVTFKEGSAEPGKILPVTLAVPSNVQISETNYSIPQENWTAGQKVKTTVKLTPLGNYQFGNGIRFSASNATYKEQSGDAFNRSVIFEYTPKTRLAKPASLYLDGSTLRWKKVTNASRYNVMILYDEDYTNESQLQVADMTIYYDESEIVTSIGRRSRSITVNENSIDVSDYIDVDGIENVAFRVYALPSTGKTGYYQMSEPAEFSVKQGTVESDSAFGSLTTNSRGELLYLDSSGAAISGWQQIEGAWYYFDIKGVAAGPGWKRIDKQWYYFDHAHKMQTGWIQVDDYWYYLRETTTSEGEAGSMVSGWININDTMYHLNDGISNGIPFGAWIQ